MPDIPDFESMTIDELASWKVQRREDGGRGWREEVQAANAVQDRKIADWHLTEAKAQIRLRAELESKSDAEVAGEWLTDPQPGRQVQARLFFGMPRLGREAQ